MISIPGMCQRLCFGSERRRNGHLHRESHRNVGRRRREQNLPRTRVQVIHIPLVNIHVFDVFCDAFSRSCETILGNIGDEREVFVTDVCKDFPLDGIETNLKVCDCKVDSSYRCHYLFLSCVDCRSDSSTLSKRLVRHTFRRQTIATISFRKCTRRNSEVSSTFLLTFTRTISKAIVFLVEIKSLENK